MENNSLETLKKFSEFVKKIIDESITRGEIQKLEVSQEYFRWRAESFEYSIDKGISVPRAHGESFTKKQLIFKHNIEESIKQSNEYKTVLAHLSRVFEDEGLDYKLEQLLRRIVHHYLYESEIEEKLLEVFLKELRGEPIKIGAIVELQGVTLEPDNIEVAYGVKLRRPTINDVEKERPVYGYGVGVDRFPYYPSAILELKTLGHPGSKIQDQVENAIAILRLFKVGGVKYASYHIFSEAVVSFMGGTFTPGERFGPSESYPIFNSDVKRLQKFWKEMMISIPGEFTGFSGSAQKGNLTFAYQRYSDALLSNGFLERRIANAIMGLETLYLNESRELGRYLRLRVSKFLGISGWDPHKVMNLLKDAYAIRSIFVHGNRLSHKQKKGFEEKYGSINKILMEVLEYLRVSIVLVLFLKKEKDELIDLIDNSLIDRKMEDAFSTQINEIKTRLAIAQPS